MAVGAVYLIIKIPSERAELDRMSTELLTKPAKPLTNLDLTLASNLITRAVAGGCLDLATTNKVFNSVPWQKKADGLLIKLTLGNEVGPDAVIVTRITNLN